MTERDFPGTLLVGLDFEPSSHRALDAALAWRRPGSDVIAVHVVDLDLAARLEAVGVCTRADGIVACALAPRARWPRSARSANGRSSTR